MGSDGGGRSRCSMRKWMELVQGEVQGPGGGVADDSDECKVIEERTSREKKK